MAIKESLLTIVKTKRFAVLVGSVISLAAGVSGGYFFAKKRLETKYSDLSEREIREAKLFYQQRNKTGDFSDPTSLAEKYEDLPEETRLRIVEAVTVISEYDSGVVTQDEEQEEHIQVIESIRKNVFDNPEAIHFLDDDFELDDELDKKREGRPYIIESEQFFENEEEFEQVPLVYFEGDDVLTDKRDQPIRDVIGLVGDDNLHFGRGSKEKNLVYIRNDKMRVDFEVTRSMGKYAEEVLGFIEHSERRKIHKFRDYD